MGSDLSKKKGLFKAYEGNQPYIFASYKHADSDIIYPMLKQFNDRGFNIWYDDGLQYGEDYDDLIDLKIEESSLFIICITERVIKYARDKDEYMKKELDVAIETETPILPIFIHDVKLKGKYRMQLRGKHSIFKFEYASEDEFLKECVDAFENDFGLEPESILNEDLQPKQGTANISQSQLESIETVGIDLGTSYSSAYVYADGKPIMVPNVEGTTTYGKAFPSCVSLTDEGVVVGEPASQDITENIIKHMKRHMGTDYKVEIQDKVYTPQLVTAFILAKIKKDTEAFLGKEISKAVISVPAYFDHNQRCATIDAAKIAGLEVLKLISEPTAASLAYYNDNCVDATALVFDLGGGCLDVSIVKLEDGTSSVISTAGNTMLGGKDMDSALKLYLAKEFQNDYNINLLDYSSANTRLEEAVERAKIELSDTIRTEFLLPDIAKGDDGKPIHYYTALNRSKLESLVDNIVQRCGEYIQLALDDALMTPDDIDKVILVGGPTKMPIVRKYVVDFLGKMAEMGIDSIGCVGQGAAIQAAIIEGRLQGIGAFDVLPLSLGTEVADGNTSVFVKRNTTIPFKTSDLFGTATDDQTGIMVKVVQGEHSMARDNIQLGSLLINGIPSLPRGVVLIEVTYQIDGNGILDISAVEQLSGMKLSTSMENSFKLTDEEINNARAYVFNSFYI